MKHIIARMLIVAGFAGFLSACSSDCHCPTPPPANVNIHTDRDY